MEKAKSTFPASNEQPLRSWQTADAVCQGPVLHPAQDCANLLRNRPVIRWMSVQMMAAYCQPMDVSEESLAVDAIREVGPAGHFFGISHTIDRYENAFYSPLLSNWDKFDAWIERGSVSAAVRANKIWKDLLQAYEQPAMDPAVDEHLREYVTKRKQELGCS